MAGAVVFLAGCGSSLNDVESSSQRSIDQKAGIGATSRLSASASSAAVSATTTLTAAADPASNAYKIGPLDVLDVSVFKVPELSKSVQVAEGGTVNLPLVGEIPAAGKTAQEVEHDLAAKLGAKYLQSPQVTVFVKEYNSQRVTVDGAVKKPGVYPIRGKNTLLQFIALAEGLTDAAETNVVVFRESGGKKTAAKFDIQEIRAGKIDDPAIQQGDLIVVNASAMKEAFQNVLKALPITSAFVPLL